MGRRARGLSYVSPSQAEQCDLQCEMCDHAPPAQVTAMGFNFLFNIFNGGCELAIYGHFCSLSHLV